MIMVGICGYTQPPRRPDDPTCRLGPVQERAIKLTLLSAQLTLALQGLLTSMVMLKIHNVVVFKQYKLRQFSVVTVLKRMS